MAMVLKYVLMYFCLGLVLNTGWGIFGATYLFKKCNWDEDLYEEALSVFLGEGRGSFKAFETWISDNKVGLIQALILSCTMWPYNIAYGVTRMQAGLNYIDTEKQ